MDYPWKEDARWWPKYLYVIHIKGLAFVLDNAETLKTNLLTKKCQFYMK